VDRRRREQRHEYVLDDLADGAEVRRVAERDGPADERGDPERHRHAKRRRDDEAPDVRGRGSDRPLVGQEDDRDDAAGADDHRHRERDGPSRFTAPSPRVRAASRTPGSKPRAEDG
jgi:hypothetical protein